MLPTTGSRHVLDLLDVAVVVQEADHRISYANPRALVMLGVSADDMTARTTDDARWDVVDADGAPVVADAHPGVQALLTGEPVTGVLLGVRRGDADERVWILTSAIPDLDEAGRVARVMISFTDVSATHREVREQGTVYRTVFDSLTEGIVVHEPDGRIRAANAAAERVLGLTLDQMTGRVATDARWRLVRPDGSPITGDDIPSELTARTGEPVPWRILGVHKPSGELAWLNVRADPLREPGDPALRGVVATFTDVTAERTAALALEASRLRSQRVLETVPGVVYQYLHPEEGEDRFIFVGGRIREVLGIEPELLRDSPDGLFALLDAAEQSALRAHVARVIARADVFEYEGSFRHPSTGERRWVRVRGAPERTSDGLLYTGIILDVTEARQLADGLRQSQRREAMGEMAAGVAHNFNNMLAVILPNLELVRAQVAPPLAGPLDDAERAARSASDLVRRMLSLGRSETAGDAERADLATIVHAVAEICRRTFDRRIELDADLQVPSATVRGRASELQQVVLNLCLNARDALEGRAAARIRVALLPGGPEGVRLVVEDNGAGMSEAVRARIGEPFFTTKGPVRGTGLGLASAFNTIRESGGRWEVASTPATGTTFTVHFPLVSSPEVPADATDAMDGPVAGTVLVVDDEPMVRAALSRQLQRIGYDVLEAARADEAIARLREGVPPELRVILLDRSMPGMSGEDAVPLLRALAPRVPIAVLSGYVDSGVPTAVAAVLQKPIGLRELRDALARLTRAAASPGPAQHAMDVRA